jgi:hypothetical protein
MKRLLYIALSLVAAAFVACDNTSEIGEVDLGYLKIVSSDVNFNYAGGSGEIVVDTTAPVTAVVAGDGAWATASVNGNIVTVTVPAYSGMAARNSSVTVSAGNRNVIVPISQSSLAVVLASNSTIVAKEGGEVTVGYTIITPAGETPATFENVNVTVVSDQPWVTGAIAGNQLRLTVAANSNYFNRAAIVSLVSYNETLAPQFAVLQTGEVITELARTDLDAMTWTVFANGLYESPLLEQPVEKTLSTAGSGLFRIDSPLVTNRHFYFGWDSETEGESLYPAADLILGDLPTQFTGAGMGGAPLYWRTDTDAAWTFYDAATKTFTINSQFLTIANDNTITSYGWLDDFFTIVE